MSLPQTKSPIIVVGCQRSGTTLLRTMLGKHPAIIEHPDEPQFILGLQHRFGYSIWNLPEAIEYISSHPYFPKSVDKQAFATSLKGIQNISLPGFIRHYLDAWAGTSLSYKHALLKHPQLVFHLNLVERVFENPIIVHIVRDPRANVLSQRTRWPQFSVWECAMLWRNAVRSTRNWVEKSRSPYLEIRFEDLVLQPEASLRKLVSEIGIPFSERMLEFERETTYYSVQEASKQVLSKAPDPSRIYQWKEHLSTEDCSLIDTCCWKEMAQYDYPLSNRRVRKGSLILRAAAEVSEFQYKNLGRKIMAVFRKIGWRTGVKDRTR